MADNSPNKDPGKAATRRAAIDVGTNSVKLLVADVRGHTIVPILERSIQTRLGRGFYRDHRLKPEAIRQTARVIAEFAGEARETGVARPRVIATSAAREAENRDEFMAAIRLETGLEMEIISGEQEADWVYHGVATDRRLAGEPLLIIDVGGGSTEFILGDHDSLQFRNSYRLGVVRLLEQHPHSDPPTESEREACHNSIRGFLKDNVKPEVTSELAIGRAGGLKLIGTGGTATILARIAAGIATHDREVIEATPLTLSAVRELVERLWKLPLVERRKIRGLPPERADVILTGALIYESVMEELQLSRLTVSTRGLRHAAVLQPI